mmetsp:Transcript_44280/g.143669  ORF Transcript_44280/g.143669 Transcript_44280/m.143669 type:complete len:337 (+) Transcript_44280:29-1039(+)
MKMQPRAPPHSRSVFPGVFVSAHPVAILPLPVVIARRLTQRLRGGGARSGDLLGVADRRQQVLFGKGAHQPLELLLVEDAALVEEEADGAVQLAEVVARDGEAARLPLGLAARQQGRQRLLRLPAVVPEVRGGHAACWGSDDDPARPPHRQDAVEPVEPVSKRPQPERPRPVPHGRDVDSEHVRVSRHIGRDAEGGGAGEGGAAPRLEPQEEDGLGGLEVPAGPAGMRRVDGAPLHEPDDEVEEEVAAEPGADAPQQDLAVVRPGARRGHVPRQPGPLPGEDGRGCPEPAPHSVVGGLPPRAVHVEQGGRLVVVVSRTVLPRSDPLQRGAGTGRSP